MSKIPGTGTNIPELTQWVRPIQGELTRFMVESRKLGEEPYLVDLEAWSGNGGCTCAHFEFRLRVRLEEGHPPGPFTQCWHIQMAGQFLLQMTIARLVELKRKQKPAWASWYEWNDRSERIVNDRQPTERTGATHR